MPSKTSNLFQSKTQACKSYYLFPWLWCYGKRSTPPHWVALKTPAVNAATWQCKRVSKGPTFQLCLDAYREKVGKGLFHVIVNTGSCLYLQKLLQQQAFQRTEDRMKWQSRFLVFRWISDLDFTPKMPVFHFLNLNNKYVFLQICISTLY